MSDQLCILPEQLHLFGINLLLARAESAVQLGGIAQSLLVHLPNVLCMSVVIHSQQM